MSTAAARAVYFVGKCWLVVSSRLYGGGGTVGRQKINIYIYLLIDLFDYSINKNTSTQRPTFDAF